MKERCFIGALVLSLIGLMLAAAPGGSAQQTFHTQVRLTGGDNDALRGRIESNLTTILNSRDVSQVSSLFSERGFTNYTDLRAKTGFRCVSVLYETELLTLPGGDYEVRGLRVRVRMKDTPGNPDQFLVFTLNGAGLVKGVRFAMEKRHYEDLLDEGERLEDFSRRQKILHFLEIFRTAYNRKDIEYIRQAYSDDALIIVGRVLETSPDGNDMLENSYLTRDKIRFVKLSKAEYLDRLERVFQLNDFVKVDFTELEVLRHDSITDIYGVTLKQRWRSSTYSDEGYLFLMIDFQDEERPLVHVRTWQPEKFPDSSVISLYDFNIIDY